MEATYKTIQMDLKEKENEMKKVFLGGKKQNVI